MESQKPVHTIVLDTGAIIRNNPTVSTLLAQSEQIVTVPAIITEIRDAATRTRVETQLMPFLTIRSPNPASIKFVTDFARRTGDLDVLSKPDIQIVALAYELEGGAEIKDGKSEATTEQAQESTDTVQQISEDLAQTKIEETEQTATQHQEKDLSGNTSSTGDPQSVLQVATLTTDFAMQNVLLQINLNLLSPTMQRVKHLKTYILRCHACFCTTKEMSKQFCPRCGSPTLTRVACSTSSNGEFKLHLKKNMQWNTRGDRFSIPKPVHGSANGRVQGGVLFSHFTIMIINSISLHKCSTKFMEF
ncbi:unnamed protein product [Aureobasidium pullulans]|nr:unnamed protein product [Aureobasidium pullulans]